jgi:hypothetical protein
MLRDNLSQWGAEPLYQIGGGHTIRPRRSGSSVPPAHGRAIPAVPVVLPLVERGITGLPLALPVPRPPGTYRLRLRYGALAEPRGAEVEVIAAAAATTDRPLMLARVPAFGVPVRPADTIALLLESWVRGVTAGDYTTTVQLLGPDGRLVAQADGPPFRGAPPRPPDSPVSRSRSRPGCVSRATHRSAPIGSSSVIRRALRRRRTGAATADLRARGCRNGHGVR